MDEMRLVLPAVVVDPRMLLQPENTQLRCSDGETLVAKGVLWGIEWFNNSTRKKMKEGDTGVELTDFSVRVVEDWALLRCGIVPKELVSRDHYKELKRLADYIGDKGVAQALSWSRQLHKSLLCEVDGAGIERRLRRLRAKDKAYQPLVDKILCMEPSKYRAAIVECIGDVQEGWRLWKSGKLQEAAEMGVTAACYEWARKEIKGKGDRKKALEFLEKAVRRGYPGAEALKADTVLGGLEREEALEMLAEKGCPYAQFYLGHYKIAADEGVAEACYRYALECEGDERIKYLRKGADGGHGKACFLLAMEWKSDRVKHREAIRLLEKCDTVCKEVRAKELYQIWKSRKNNRRSRKSLVLASNLGHALAKAHLVLGICCGKEVTEGQLVEGEKLIEQFEKELPGLAALCRLCLSKFHGREVVFRFIEDKEVDCELGYRLGKWCVDNGWAREGGAACLVKGMSDPDPDLAWRSLRYFIGGQFTEEVIKRFSDRVIAAARRVLYKQKAKFQAVLTNWLWNSKLKEGRDLAVEVWEQFQKTDGYACYCMSVVRNDLKLLKRAAVELDSIDAILDLCRRRRDGEKLVEDSTLYQCLLKISFQLTSRELRERVAPYLRMCRDNVMDNSRNKCVIC